MKEKQVNLITIIIPTYNSSDFLQRSLNSLVNQSSKNFDIIISDDGSTDDTLSILSSYKSIFQKKNINFMIIANKHMGPGNARNQGIIKSNTEWLAFLDSDDSWQNDKIEILQHHINKNDKEINCFINNEKFIKNNVESEFSYSSMFNENMPIFNQLFKKNFLSPSSICIKKELVVKHGMFDQKMENAQDYDLWLKIGNDFKIKKINQYLTNYFYRSGNITSKPYYKRIRNLIIIIFRNRRKTSSYEIIKKLIRIFVSKEWFR